LQPKTIVLLIIYMTLVYTTVGIFTSNTIAERGLDTAFATEKQIEPATIGGLPINLSGKNSSEIFAWLNATHDEYKEYAVLGWFTSLNPWDWNHKYYHIWNDGYRLTDTEFEKILSGSIIDTDVEWWEAIYSFFDTIGQAIGYFFSLLIFNVHNVTLEDGSYLPFYLTWIPLFMVLPVWITVTYMLFPYLIKLLHAIAEVIPL
jgi:hypothetical protein